MDSRDGGVQRVGAILGQPVAVDPQRPNTLGGATPHRQEARDYPLYRVEKRCRACGQGYLGESLAPQYDDDEPQYGWCGCVIKTSAGEGRWGGRMTRPRLAGSAPTRRPRDPLED